MASVWEGHDSPQECPLVRGVGGYNPTYGWVLYSQTKHAMIVLT